MSLLKSSQNNCISCKAKDLLARWYPPGGGNGPLSEDNKNVSDFTQQRLTRQPHPPLLQDLEGDNDNKIIEDIDEIEEMPKSPPPLDPEEYEEYNTSVDVPRYDQVGYLGPSYGHPSFYASLELMLRKFAQQFKCKCNENSSSDTRIHR